MPPNAVEKIVLGKDGDVKGDLERELDKINSRLDGVAKVGEDHKALAETVASFKEMLRGLDTRLASHSQGKVRLPLTQRDWKKLGWTAVLKAPTTVEKYDDPNRLFEYKENEHPVALFQEECDNLYAFGRVAGFITDKGGVDPRIREHWMFRERYLPLYKEVEAMLKGGAFDTQTAGDGAEFIPTEYSARLVEKVRLELIVASFFEQVTQPRATWILPVWLNDLTPYLITEVLDDTAASVAYGNTQGSNVTANRTFTAKGIGGSAFVGKDLEDDSIIPMVALLNRGMIICIRRGVDDAALNGDTTAAHMDSDVTASNDRRKAWLGLRKTALAVAASACKKDCLNAKIWDGTNNNWSLIGSDLRGLMGSTFGTDPSQLALIVGGKVNLQIVQLPDFRLAASLAGNAAGSNITGVVGRRYGGFNPDGLDYGVSEFARETLNAAGVYDGVTTDRATAILVHKPSWICGTLKNATISVLREARAMADQDVVLGKIRMSFNQPIPASATNPHTVIAYNIGT